MNRLPRLPAHPLTAALLALALSASWAQSATDTPGATPPPAAAGARTATPSAASLARADRRFIEDAVATGHFVVQASQVASNQAQDAAVKDFARQLADQHRALNQELTQLASSKGLELPTGPTRMMRREIQSLGKKTGASFDLEFVQDVGVQTHQREIKRFQGASRLVKDSQLKSWIDKSLPTLQALLAQAQRLPQGSAEAARSGAGGTGSMGSSGNPAAK